MAWDDVEEAFAIGYILVYAVIGVKAVISYQALSSNESEDYKNRKRYLLKIILFLGIKCISFFVLVSRKMEMGYIVVLFSSYFWSIVIHTPVNLAIELSSSQGKQGIARKLEVGLVILTWLLFFSLLIIEYTELFTLGEGTEIYSRLDIIISTCLILQALLYSYYTGLVLQQVPQTGLQSARKNDWKVSQKGQIS